MNNMPDLQKHPIIIGDNFACLTALHKLSSNGVNVIHISQGKKLGGHFAGVETNEGVFDIGMVLLELNFNGNTKLEDMNPFHFTGWIESFDYIKSWISNSLEFQSITSPKVYINGELYPDYLIADKLDCFISLNEEIFPVIPNKAELHPKNKHNSNLYEHVSFKEVSIATLGHEFYYQFAHPWIQKLLGEKSDIPFLAKYHRALWLPLYYPETVSDFVSKSDNKGIEEYVFHRPKVGTVADWTRRLSKEIEGNHYVIKRQCKLEDNTAVLKEIINKKDLSNVFVDCEPMKFSKLFLGYEEKLSNSLNISLQLIFGSVDVVSIKPILPGIINIVDSKVKGYRLAVQRVEIKNYKNYRLKISLEVSINENKDSQILTEEEFASNIKNLLELYFGERITNIKMLDNLIAMNASEIPTPERVYDINSIASLSTSYAKTTGLNLSGNLLGYSRGSMNDQIAQGLLFANKVISNRNLG